MYRLWCKDNALGVAKTVTPSFFNSNLTHLGTKARKPYVSHTIIAAYEAPKAQNNFAATCCKSCGVISRYG